MQDLKVFTMNTCRKEGERPRAAVTASRRGPQVGALDQPFNNNATKRLRMNTYTSRGLKPFRINTCKKNEELR